MVWRHIRNKQHKFSSQYLHPRSSKKHMKKTRKVRTSETSVYFNAWCLRATIAAWQKKKMYHIVNVWLLRHNTKSGQRGRTNTFVQQRISVSTLDQTKSCAVQSCHPLHTLCSTLFCWDLSKCLQDNNTQEASIRITHVHSWAHRATYTVTCPKVTWFLLLCTTSLFFCYMQFQTKSPPRTHSFLSHRQFTIHCTNALRNCINCQRTAIGIYAKAQVWADVIGKGKYKYCDKSNPLWTRCIPS